MITAILVLLLFMFLIVYVFTKEGRPPNYPPGPSWWPFLGNGFMLRELSKKMKGQHLALAQLAEDYNTPILGLKLGRDLIVVALTPDAVKAVLTRDVFTGRPKSFFMKLRCFGKIQGITSSDGDLWKEQRMFTVRQLKQYGFGKEAMESLIQNEVKELLVILKKEDRVKCIGEVIAPCVLNVLWAFVTGKRLEKTDPRLKKLLKLLNRRSRAFDMAGGILNQMPWLRHVAPRKTGFSLLQELNSELKNFLMKTIEEQKKTYDFSCNRSLIDAFLKEQNLQRKYSNFSDEELVVLLLDLFLGGAQTTSQTLDFAMLVMIKNQSIQDKVFRNLVENIGRDTLPTLEDRSKLLYIEAVILEVMRMFCVVPIIGPRRSLKDTKLNGYFVPKNTTILLNLYTVHHDEKLFPDPHTFRPERFLNSKGELIDTNNVWAFGLGKRRCLGESLAKSCIFLIFASIMQNFKITKVSDEEPSLDPLIGLTLAPKPYSAQFHCR